MNKILKLYEEDFVLKLFKKEVLPKYPEFLSIERIEIQRHKSNIWEKTYHVVIEFKTYFLDKYKKKHLRPIFCVAHSEEPRKNVHIVLEYLWKNGFNKGDLTIPKPLFYSEEFRGTFYEGVEGINLYQFVRVKDKEKIEEIIPRAAQLFNKLHQLPTEGAHNFNEENSRIRTVIPGYEHILERIEDLYPKYTKLYKKAYEYFISEEEMFLKSEGKRWIVHGDAHPENIIRMNSQKTAIIDFTDMCLTDFTRDLGCFLQQIEFMIMRKICDHTYAEKIKKIFLDEYVRNAKIKIDKDLQKRIDIYYHWTMVRTATFFLIKDKPDPARSMPLLKEVGKYLETID